MFRPLAVDLLFVILPLFLAVAMFAWGRVAWHGPRFMQLLLVGSAIALIAIIALTLSKALPFDIRPLLYILGGGTVLLSLASLILLGFVWSVPGRSFSSAFLVVLSLIAGCLILIESSGPILWRFGGEKQWQRFADDSGCLRQTSSLTCGPTAAVMLLHQYGIPASEGEMAYLANTSPFGSDAWSLARALDRKVASHGMRAEVLFTDYDACLKRGQPFLAHVHRSSTGGHGILVESMTPDFATIIDPADGLRSQEPRERFIKEWDSTAIYLVPSTAH